MFPQSYPMQVDTSTITPIRSDVASLLPNTLMGNAPSAYWSVGLNNQYLPKQVIQNTSVPSWLPESFHSSAKKMGFGNPDSTLTKATQTADGVGKSFGELGFDKKAGTVLGTLGTVYGMYNAHQQMKLAKDQLAYNKAESERNYQAQRKMTNSQLEDRQKRRVEEAQANGRTTASVSDYMNKYGL